MQNLFFLIVIHFICQDDKDNILSKCNWSPFEGETLNGVVTHTIINGNLVYENGLFNESRKGMRLVFER